MEQGFKTYIKEGMQTSKKIIKASKVSRFKFYFLWISSFISYLLVLPAPIFLQANINMDKQNVEDETYHLGRIFSNTDNPKNYWSNLMAFLIKLLLFLGGFIGIAIIVAILYLVGNLLAQITSVGLISILFIIPGAIALLVYICGFRLTFAPLYYYYNDKEDLAVSKGFNGSIKTMKEHGKKTLFALDLVHLLIIVGYLAIVLVVGLGLLSSSEQAIKLIGWLIVIVGIIFFIPIGARLGIAHRVAKYKLIKDIMLDPEVALDPTLLKENLIKQGLSKDEFLMDLFEKPVAEDAKVEIKDSTNEGELEEAKEESEELEEDSKKKKKKNKKNKK